MPSEIILIYINCNSTYASVLNYLISHQSISSTMRRIIIRSFSIYETRELLLLVGECWDIIEKTSANEGFRVIEIRRPVVSNEKIDAIHHKTLYSQREITDLIKVYMASLLYSNCFCLTGVIQLLRSHYLMVVTKAEAVASIHGRDIYTVQDSVLVPITFKMRNTFDDSRYKSIFQNAQFSKGFYFSFSFDITNCLQSISYKTLASPAYRYMWNSHLLDNFFSLFSADKDTNIDSGLNNWVVFMTHGFINQQNIPLVDGRYIRYTLISRRSQYFAGTRYLRRGVNVDGNVANEVETEQIITVEDSLSQYGCYRSSSLVQLRGSLPLCWSHNNIFAPNPDIFIDSDDIAYRLTRLHMNDMANRYGTRFHMLNLIRISESHREEKLGNEMKSALFSLSSKDFDSKLISRSQVESQIIEEHEFVVVSDCHSMKLRYLCYDVLAHEQIQHSVFDVLSDISKSVLPDTGFFLQGENSSLNDDSTNFRNVAHKFQEGILRTNCVDCLDRTNIAQFCYAKYALTEQLKALDVELTPSALDSLQLLVLEIWVQNGDVLALQYAGSEAMHKVEEKKRSSLFTADSAPSISVSTGAVSDMSSTSLPREKDTEYVLSGSTYKAIAAVRRYYSNVSSDFERQRAMDLLLGVYQTSEDNHKHIWEIDQRPHVMRGLHMPSKFYFLRALCDEERLFRPLFPVLQSPKETTQRQKKLKKAAHLRGAYHQDDFYTRSSFTSFESIANQSFNKHALHQLSGHNRIQTADDSRREFDDQYLPRPTTPPGSSVGVVACDEEDRVIEEGFLAYLGREFCVTGRAEEEYWAALAWNRSDDSRTCYERSLRNMLRPLDTAVTSMPLLELFPTDTSAARASTSSQPSDRSYLRKKEKRKCSRIALGHDTVDDFLTFFPPLEETESGSELDQPKELQSFQSPRLDAIGEGIKSFIALSSGLSFGLPELSSNATSDEVKVTSISEVVNNSTKANIESSVFNFPSKWFSFT